MADPPSHSASFDLLATLAEEFTTPLAGHLGRFARLTDGFYSYQVATRALQRLRLDLLNGAVLTPGGARFVAGAAAFLATLAALSWQRRGLEVEALVTYGGGDEERISVGAFRHRDGGDEHYVHDVLHDLRGYLLQQARLEGLRADHPGDWFLDTALGALLMSRPDGKDARSGEEILTRCVATTPDCATAHLSLGTHLKHQGRRDEAMAIFEDAVRRWPWHSQAVDCCLWMVTDGMTLPVAAT